LSRWLSAAWRLITSIFRARLESSVRGSAVAAQPGKVRLLVEAAGALEGGQVRFLQAQAFTRGHGAAIPGQVCGPLLGWFVPQNTRHDPFAPWMEFAPRTRFCIVVYFRAVAH
jgi:hypothetical protein